MLNKKTLGQSSFLIKSLFTVIAAALFIFVIYSFGSFRADVVKQKAESDFKISALNILQKLVSDESCLAYKEGNPQKPILSKDKIDQFAATYSSSEPDCAKAIDFDYSITITQLPYSFVLYPGEKQIKTELEFSTDFAQHECMISNTQVLYVKCNFIPNQEICEGVAELDPGCGWGSNIPICEDSCFPDPLAKCPYPSHPICCFNFYCPADKCECISNELGGHPWIVSCDNANLSTDCTRVGCEHSWCGKTSRIINVPVGSEIGVGIEGSVWAFSIPLGVNSFSQGKAKYGESQFSLPITIRYNATFSTEGIIYMYAVRGELEDLSGLLDDICEKVKAGLTDIKFTKEFHFSYPVSYDNSTSKLCMGSNCKTFICSSSLEFPNIEKDGDYQLDFSFDSLSNKIVVKK